MLIRQTDAVVIIFNLQKEFISSLQEGQKLIDSCCWLADLAQHLSVPAMILNHKKLGEPLKGLQKLVSSDFCFEVTSFSCFDDTTVKATLMGLKRKQIILAGAETHVSLLQTAIAGQELGYEVFIIADAASTRNIIDHNLALQRCSQASASIVTKEMFFFDIIKHSEYPNYIDMSLKFLDQRYIRD